MTITQTMKMYLKYKGNNQWEPEIEHIEKSVQMEGEWSSCSMNKFMAQCIN
jgi:hypothetical protein